MNFEEKFMKFIKLIKYEEKFFKVFKVLKFVLLNDYVYVSIVNHVIQVLLRILIFFFITVTT